MIEVDAIIDGAMYSWHSDSPFVLEPSDLDIFVAVPRALTTVCSAEVLTINSHLDELKDLGFNVYIVTSDSAETIDLWLRDEDMTKNGQVKVPVLGVRRAMLDDSFTSKAISSILESVHGFPDRCTIIISNKEKIESIDKSPLSMERSIGDLLRKAKWAASEQSKTD